LRGVANGGITSGRVASRGVASGRITNRGVASGRVTTRSDDRLTRGLLNDTRSNLDATEVLSEKLDLDLSAGLELDDLLLGGIAR
jgi:hypothetical protein